MRALFVSVLLIVVCKVVHADIIWVCPVGQPCQGVVVIGDSQE